MAQMGWSYPEWKATPVKVINETLDALNAKALAQKHSGGHQ
jgi:hypothetical protein